MERTVVNDGVRLLVRDHDGPGTPVVLLHGLAGHSGEWDETAAWLREDHRVVVFDQRAHGASERCPADVSRTAYVSDLVAVIDALGWAVRFWWASRWAVTRPCSRPPPDPTSFMRS